MPYAQRDYLTGKLFVFINDFTNLVSEGEVALDDLPKTYNKPSHLKGAIGSFVEDWTEETVLRRMETGRWYKPQLQAILDRMHLDNLGLEIVEIDINIKVEIKT